jgi:hypothetical protein
MRLGTPHAELAVLGTQFTLISAARTTFLGVTEGAVHVMSRLHDKPERVEQGYFATIAERVAKGSRVYTGDLLFYASYDESADADFAVGSRKQANDETPRLTAGKFGQGLFFNRRRGMKVCEYSTDGNVLPNEGTVAFYFKPSWAGTDETSRYFFFWPGLRNESAGVNKPNSLALRTELARERMAPNSRGEPNLWFWYDDRGGENNTVRTSIAHWQADRWVHVAATWKHGAMALYFDGELANRQPLRGPITEPGRSFFAGASRNGAFSCDGVIDELCIYGRALGPDEIGLLTRKPEFLAPRIHMLQPAQQLFYVSDRYIRFECRLTGEIDSLRHKLRITLARERGEGRMEFTRRLTGRGIYAIEAHVPTEGDYHMRVALQDEHGRRLDERTGIIHFFDGPFEAR